MNAHRYIFSVIQLLQRDFNQYTIVTPGEFDVLYRWWEKGIPLKIIRDCVADVLMKRGKQGRSQTKIRDYVHTVRKTFVRYQEQNVGGHGRLEQTPAPQQIWSEFLNGPPDEIADLVEQFLVGLSEKGWETERIDSFYRELMERYADDEELERKTTVFLQHLAPALRTEDLLKRYRLNLLISRFRIPDLEENPCES